MSSAIIKEAKDSAVVNRIRSIYEDNANDELLESLRLQSLNFSHDYENRSLKRLFVPNNGPGNGEDQKKFFSPRKRFHDHVSSVNSSTSIESLNLETRQFVYDSSLSHKSISSEYSSHHLLNGSDRSVHNSAKNCANTSPNPIHRILNFCYKQLSSIKTQTSSGGNAKKGKNESDDESNTHDDLTTSRSFISVKCSFSPPSYQKLVSLDDVGYTESDCEGYCVPASNRQSSKQDSTKHYTPPESLLSNGLRSGTDGSLSANDGVFSSIHDGNDDYSFISNDSSCTFHLSFERLLSKIDDPMPSAIPEKLVVNKSPFLIGYDRSCDLIINKCKYIQRKHCELVFEKVNGGNPKRSIFRHKIAVVKRDNNAVIYVNNAILHDVTTLKDGDLLSLGSRDNYIGFRVIFRPLDDSSFLTKIHSSFLSDKGDRLNLSQTSLMYNEFDSDTKVDKRNVRVLIFEVVCNNISFLGPYSRNSSLSDQSDISIADVDDIVCENQASIHEIENNDERVTYTNMNDTGHYKLQSPNRHKSDTPLKNLCKSWDLSPSASPSSFERLSTLKLDNISPGSGMLLDAYGDTQSKFSSSKNTSSGKSGANDKAFGSNTEKTTRDKLLLFRSLNSKDFPIIIDSESSYTNDNLTPKAEEKPTMNYIGTICTSNNKRIHELLPDIEKLLRTYHSMEEDSEEYGMDFYDIIIKHYSNPVDKDSLKKSWVFQLDHIDWDNKHLRRAIYRNNLISDGIKDKMSGRPVNSLEANKYRVIYIRRKDIGNLIL